LGLFPEILRGQQRITLVNGILIVAMISRLALVWWATHQHWGFTAYMLIALGFTLLPDIIAAPLALKHMPEVKLSLRAVSLRALGSTASFSIFAYIGTCTNLILGKTDQLVLASGIGIGAVALYQAAGKAGEIFRDFTKQLQDALSPAAAHLHAMGEHAVLGQLLVKATRWSIIVATPLYLLCAFYLDEVLRVLTGRQGHRARDLLHRAGAAVLVLHHDPHAQRQQTHLHDDRSRASADVAGAWGSGGQSHHLGDAGAHHQVRHRRGHRVLDPHFVFRLGSSSGRGSRVRAA